MALLASGALLCAQETWSLCLTNTVKEAHFPCRRASAPPPMAQSLHDYCIKAAWAWADYIGCGHWGAGSQS